MIRRWVPIALLLAIAARADGQTIRLRGTVVSPDRATVDQVVTIEGGRIRSVAPASGASDAVAAEGVIFPGLIDLHNHLTWNVMPNWHPPRLFTNRYEWQATADYQTNLGGPYYWLRDSYRDANCDMNLFGEVKALVNGATATLGSLTPDRRNGCILGLVRNLDFASELYGGDVNKEPFRNLVFPLAPRIDPNATPPVDEEQDIRSVNRHSTNGVRAVVMHLAEGSDASAAREFASAKAFGFLREGVSVIHGVALTADQMAELARAKVGLVWSPRSNFILYGKTAEIRAAVANQMTIAIAPDWSPSGSAGMLEELQFANRYAAASAKEINDVALVKMATSAPATLAAIDSRVGSIDAGKLADLVVMKAAASSPPYQALFAGPAAVRLVMIGGVPRYGDPALMKALAPNAPLEPLTVCGEPKLLNLAGAGSTWAQLLSRLSAAMKPIGMSPSPLASCTLD